MTKEKDGPNPFRDLLGKDPAVIKALDAHTSNLEPPLIGTLGADPALTAIDVFNKEVDTAGQRDIDPKALAAEYFYQKGYKLSYTNKWSEINESLGYFSRELTDEFNHNMGERKVTACFTQTQFVNGEEMSPLTPELGVLLISETDLIEGQEEEHLFVFLGTHSSPPIFAARYDHGRLAYFGFKIDPATQILEDAAAPKEEHTLILNEIEEIKKPKSEEEETLYFHAYPTSEDDGFACTYNNICHLSEIYKGEEEDYDDDFTNVYARETVHIRKSSTDMENSPCFRRIHISRRNGVLILKSSVPENKSFYPDFKIKLPEEIAIDDIRERLLTKERVDLKEMVNYLPFPFSVPTLNVDMNMHMIKS